MSGDVSQFTTPDPTLNNLKDAVLASQKDFLLEELGDPGRYLPHLRSRGVLGMNDCQVIRSKETFGDKIESLISFLRGRESNKSEHSFDVLVEALKKQRVQAHIARGLQKALVKAKEASVSDDKKNGEDMHLKSMEPLREPYQVDDKHAEQDYHPEFGQLPVPPTMRSQPKVSCHHETVADSHPEYGKLPPPSHNEVEEMSHCSTSSSSQWTNHSECYESSIETELGGQGGYNSVSSSTQISDVFHQSFSTPSGSLSDCSFSSNGHDPMEVTKLKAMVQHLNERLNEATVKLDEKDAKILDLEKKLQEYQCRGSREDRVLSKDKADAPYHPQPLRHNSSPFHLQNSTVYSPYRYNNTVPTVASNSMDHFHHRGSDTVVYNMAYSRNNTNASVSTL